MQNSAAILLVDDNAVQAAVRQTILRRAGYFVIAALNPVRALEQLRHGDFLTEVRLVVTDHIMPGMSGARVRPGDPQGSAQDSCPGDQRNGRGRRGI